MVLLLACSALLASACETGRTEPLLEPVGQSAVRGALTVTPIRFGTKNDAPRLVEVDAEMGILEVPLRHAEPEGGRIKVRFVRFSRAETASGPNHPIVYLAGGPGGSGVWSAAGDRFPLFDSLRQVADVIAYDQRGTWGTEPYLVCPDSWDYPLDRPGELETLRHSKRAFLESCFAHWSESTDLSAFNTVESAADLEALRVALGAEKLTLWGISYGTHLGLAYLRAYPERVDKAILHGIEGPADTYKLPERVDLVFRRVADAIASDPDASAAIPDFLGSYRELLERLERQPVTVEVEHPETGETISIVVGAEDLRRAAYGLLGEREDIEELVDRAAPILAGDLTGLGLAAVGGRRGNRESAMALSMDCASGVSPERRALIEAQAPASLLGNRSASLWASCDDWPVEDLGEDFRSPVESNVPVLFISGSLDVKTPPENAEEVLPGFPNGRHLVILGAAHDDDLLLSPGVREAMLDFLAGRVPPERIDLGPLEFELP